MAAKKGSLSISSENIFPIIKKWVYSDHDIFVRELISNGCDAITKLKKLDMMGEYELPDKAHDGHGHDVGQEEHAPQEVGQPELFGQRHGQRQRQPSPPPFNPLRHIHEGVLYRPPNRPVKRRRTRAARPEKPGPEAWSDRSVRVLV